MAYNVVPDESFVNPYNFVSLGLKCERHEASEDAKFSGVIRCKLKTLTPLFIPNTTKQFTYKAMVAKGGKPPVEVDCKEMDFFSYEDLRKYTSETYYANHPCPIIPGSSIRGVIRCAFETLTDSCLSTVDDEVLLHRRSSIPKRPGLIITDQTTKQPVLYDAEKLMLNMARHYSDVKGRRIADENLSKFGVDQSRDRLLYHTGQTVYVRKTQRKYGEYKTDRRYVELYGVEEIKTSSTPGFQEGYVLLGEDFQLKHHDAVFLKRNLVGKLTDEEMENLRNVWNLYRDKSEFKAYKGYWTSEPKPVYYEVVDGVRYMSPACLTQEVFWNTITSILEKSGGYNPCTKIGSLCEACRLFGLIGDDENSLASRVMFMDAKPVPLEPDTDYSSYYEDPRELPILGGPQITATEFYMEDVPGANYYNYDYKVGPSMVKGIDARIRGRKFYWHSKDLAPADHQRLDMTSKVRAVKADKCFEFDVHVDRVTEDELKKLVLALTLNFDGKPQEQWAHKMGHGKPVGYGSAKIEIEKIDIYSLNDDFVFESADWTKTLQSYSPVETVRIKEYKRLTDFSNAPSKVAYPYSYRRNNDKTVYAWFAANTGNINSPSFKNVLPHATSSNQQLELAVFKELKGREREAYFKGNRDEQEEIAENAGILSTNIAPKDPGEGEVKRQLVDVQAEREAKANAEKPVEYKLKKVKDCIKYITGYLFKTEAPSAHQEDKIDYLRDFIKNGPEDKESKTCKTNARKALKDAKLNLE